jgi:RES domain-containing protein
LTITSWRIVKKKHVARAFDGEGARVNGGRWNSAGVPAIYTAGSIALAILEMLVHGVAPLVANYSVIPVTFDSALLQNVDVSALPAGWNKYPAPAVTIGIGDEWLRSRRSVVLRVPSAVVASESDYLLNPRHPDFASVVVGDPGDLPLDPRLARSPEGS